MTKAVTMPAWCWGLAVGCAVMPITAAAQPVVVQASYLLENDDGADVDSDTPQASPDVGRNDVGADERLTVRLRVDNVGDAPTGPLELTLQFDRGDGLWTQVWEDLEVAPSLGRAGTNGDTLLVPKTAPCTGSYVEGQWWQGTSAASAVDLGPGECTELAFVIVVVGAPAGIAYRLRLVRGPSGLPLDGYVSYPSLSARSGTYERFYAQIGAATVAGILHSQGLSAGDELGAALATMDLQGDGVQEVVVGTPGSGDGTGRVEIFERAGVSAWASVELLAEPTPTSADRFGAALASGDINGDGTQDLVVGSPGHDGVGGRFNIGQVLVFVRKASGSGFEVPVVLSDSTPTVADAFGSSVAVGDIDGNGWGDVVVGSPGDDSLSTNVGQVSVLLRNSTNDGFAPPVLLDVPGYVTDTLGHEFGAVVAVADLDIDGRGDIVVSAPLDGTGGPNVGRVYLFERNSTNDGFDVAVLAHPQPTDGDGFGASVVVADIDLDGRPDVVAGAPLDDQAGIDAGAVFCFLRRSDNTGYGIPTRLEFSVLEPGSHLGAALAAGDLDGDGLVDLAMGAPNGAVGFGSVYLAFGVAAPAAGAAELLPNPIPTPLAAFGTAAVFVGDVTASSERLMVGAPGDRAVGGSAGMVASFDGVLTRGDWAFDADEYRRVAQVDHGLVAVVGNGASVSHLFAVRHAVAADPLTIAWSGLSSCSARLAPIRLEVLRGWPTPTWEVEAVDDLAEALTALRFEVVESAATSEYYDAGGWTYWRVEQSGGDATLFTDSAATSFAVPDRIAPLQSGHLPADGAEVPASEFELTFALDEDGDCRWAFAVEPYAAMIQACDLTGGLAQRCWIHGAEEGSIDLFVACRDLLGNEDTAATATHLRYLVDTLGPSASSAVELLDLDQSPGLDGRDFSIVWQGPAPASEVVGFELCVLPAPARWSDATCTPWASVGASVFQWSGSTLQSTDGLGLPLSVRPYHAYVVSVDGEGRKGASLASASMTPTAELDSADGDPDGAFTGGGDEAGVIGDTVMTGAPGGVDNGGCGCTSATGGAVWAGTCVVWLAAGRSRRRR